MKKVITYGTFDLFHYGHKRLLERAKALGDYLIVGITADGFDRARGKINVQQSLMERMEAVKATGIADEVIVEEYEGQKIDDILRYGIDIFAIGSDWKGYFDYLKDYCQVVYLDRTLGVSSSELRAEKREVHLGLVGESLFFNKFVRESHYVNGVIIKGLCVSSVALDGLSEELRALPCVTDDYEAMLSEVDAVYILSKPSEHYGQIKKALLQGKHVLCEPPITLSVTEWEELNGLAKKNNCVLMDALRTAYSTAYYRLLLLVKSGRIGRVVSVDASCTSLRDNDISVDEKGKWNSICTWGPTALLPVFQLLGVGYQQKAIVSRVEDKDLMYDSFTKIDFLYPEAVASIKVGKGVKTEGEMVISGTNGYVYVPAPWWKTDYFEIRREDPAQNKRYFYQLDGEGIRYELLTFAKSVETKKTPQYIDKSVTFSIGEILHNFYDKELQRI